MAHHQPQPVTATLREPHPADAPQGEARPAPLTKDAQAKTVQAKTVQAKTGQDDAPQAAPGFNPLRHMRGALDHQADDQSPCQQAR